MIAFVAKERLQCNTVSVRKIQNAETKLASVIKKKSNIPVSRTSDLKGHSKASKRSCNT